MTLEELNAIVDGVSKPFKEQLTALKSEIAELKRSRATANADRLQVFELKLDQVERACDANRKHVSNLESKIAKRDGEPLKPWTKEL